MKLRHPEFKKEIWVHIDKLDKKNGRIWAVQYWNGSRWIYKTAEYVSIRSPSYTKSFKDKGQPKAMIVVWSGKVIVKDYCIFIQ